MPHFEVLKLYEGATSTTMSINRKLTGTHIYMLISFIPGLIHNRLWTQHGVLPEQYSYPWCQIAPFFEWFFALFAKLLVSAEQS